MAARLTGVHLHKGRSVPRSRSAAFSRLTGRATRQCLNASGCVVATDSATLKNFLNEANTADATSLEFSWAATKPRSVNIEAIRQLSTSLAAPPSLMSAAQEFPTIFAVSRANLGIPTPRAWIAIPVAQAKQSRRFKSETVAGSKFYNGYKTQAPANVEVSRDPS